MADTILEVKHLKKYFNTPKGLLHAVDDVNFTLERGKTLGIVGESGCGKSTTGRSILRLIEPTSGEVIFDGEDVCKKNKNELRLLRRDMQLIFQDPYASLDPRKTVSEIIAEPLKLQKLITDPKARMDRVRELMQVVGLADRLINTYPHELDGGRRQRIGIARALAMKPKLIVCDEPVSALDVSIQAQILKLMNELKKEKGTSILFITHDLGVINQMADEVAVMYCGQVVEMCKARTIFAKETTCSHPYTEGLMTSIPRLDTPVGARLEAIPGAVPHPLDLPKGCKFAPRCKYATEKCLNEEPKLELAEDNHLIRCFYPDKEARHAK